ncbi:MAG: hypothetical protein UDB11_05105 [Peptococcaceae bacterium]|nr:hypothetical protein [Peptococcaceae bacterium]
MKKRVLMVVCGVLAVALVCFLGFAALIALSPDEAEEVGPVAETTNVLGEEAPLVTLDVGVAESAEGALVFDVTPQEIIDSFNGYYWQDKGERYFRPLTAWRQEAVENTVMLNQPQTQYVYTADESVWTLPQVNVYVPEGESRVAQIALTYDEHSYSEATYALFEEDCFYMLKTFFPDLSDEKLTSLYKTVNQLGYDHTFPSTEQYRPGMAKLPVALYYRDGIGIFSYFAIGAPFHFCVVPVDEALVASYAAGGVEVVEIA